MVVATTPGLMEVQGADFRRATMCYAPFGITEAMFRTGVPSISPELEDRHPLELSVAEKEIYTGVDESQTDIELVLIAFAGIVLAIAGSVFSGPASLLPALEQS